VVEQRGRDVGGLFGFTLVNVTPSEVSRLVSSVPASKVSTGSDEPSRTKASAPATCALAFADCGSRRHARSGDVAPAIAGPAPSAIMATPASKVFRMVPSGFLFPCDVPSGGRPAIPVLIQSMMGVKQEPCHIGSYLIP